MRVLIYLVLGAVAAIWCAETAIQVVLLTTLAGLAIFALLAAFLGVLIALLTGWRPDDMAERRATLLQLRKIARVRGPMLAKKRKAAKAHRRHHGMGFRHMMHRMHGGGHRR